MALKLLAWDDVGNRTKRTLIDPAAVVDTTEVRCGRQSIVSGATTLSVTYTSPFPDLNYALNLSWQNTVDPSPQFQPYIIVSQEKEGFVVRWNVGTESGNYSFNYHAESFV